MKKDELLEKITECAKRSREQLLCPLQREFDVDYDWEKKYGDYLSFFDRYNGLNIHKLRNSPIEYYTTFTEEMKTKETVILRYKGQEIGRITGKGNEGHLIVSADTNKNNIIYFPGYEKIGIMPGKKYRWFSKHDRSYDVALAYRKFFSSNPDMRIKSREHALESMLLDDFVKTTSDHKRICGIRPIAFRGKACKYYKRFQMPTPLYASNVKKGINTIRYSKGAGKGGGIDILARRGVGKSCIAVIELKDENKKEESPEKVILQATAYAVFIRELLRSEKANRNGSWYKWMGYKNEIGNKNVRIKCVVAMPNIEDVEMFSGMKYAFTDKLYDGKYDYLTFHCISICLDDKGEIERLVHDDSF